MKYKGGYLISTGQPKKDYIDHAIRYIIFPQGVIGLQVKIMLPSDPTGRQGVAKPLPDKINIQEPKDNDEEDFFNLQTQEK